MALSRIQMEELKKIQSSYKKMERFSAENRLSLDEFAQRTDFYFENRAEEKRKQTFEQSRDRRSVYESEGRNRAF